MHASSPRLSLSAPPLFAPLTDPTGGYGIGHPRRVEAQKLLNATSEGSLTPEHLYEVISSKGVFAGDADAVDGDGTVFQAIINVETGLWNVSIPTQSAPEAELSGIDYDDFVPFAKCVFPGELLRCRTNDDCADHSVGKLGRQECHCCMNPCSNGMGSCCVPCD